MNRKRRRRLEARARQGKATSLTLPDDKAEEMDRVAREASTAFVECAIDGVDETTPGLEPGPRRLIAETTTVMRQYMSSQAFRDIVANKIGEAVEPILVETIAEWMPRLEERVRSQVKATFETRIEAEVRQRVDAAIEEVRRRIV